MSDFSKQKIFADDKVNALVDRIYYEIETALPEEDLTTTFCLTGTAAALLQGMEDKPCRNITFLTNSVEVLHCTRDILPKKLPHTGVLKFETRTLYYFDGLYLEFWYQEEAITIKTASYAYVQDINEINENTL